MLEQWVIPNNQEFQKVIPDITYFTPQNNSRRFST